ncbi:uroporphyrinogen-III C-methyltransferase [Cognatilysobacter bugurensis]|uniref:uroporphyrinogen-III C-methyltransferase n=1 Tax=Cognatilysobacter bugurensis TaxID=543356 RepID=UPI001671DBC2|nr:uroporphyrinogen-III C-methyltransferase [Lysobacter bugurensis]
MSTPRRAITPWLLVVALTGALGVGAWQWQVRESRREAEAAESQSRLAALEARLDALRLAQRGQQGRLQHADATNRVLRDELLALGERAALLEDTLARLAQREAAGLHALRLDEVELLLAAGVHRAQLMGDLDGARRAYALAAGVLDGLADPALTDLRQTLAHERASLDAAGADPRTQALAELTALGRRVSGPVPMSASPADTAPGWQRLLGTLVDVRPSATGTLPREVDRAAWQAALQLELGLARAAAERRDATAFRGALARVGQALRTLWPASAARERQLARVQALSMHALSPTLPALGTTLQQLRQRHGSR